MAEDHNPTGARTDQAHLPAVKPDQALARLLGPQQGVFRDKIWGRRPVLVAHCAEAQPSDAGFDDLFSQSAVDELIATRGLSATDVTMAKNGATLPTYRITSQDDYDLAGEEIDSGKVLSEFVDGATINFPTIERLWPPLRHFCHQLQAELGHPVRCSAHTLPPGLQDRTDIYRVYDQFILQVAGTTTWRVGEPILVDPLPSQPWHEYSTGLVDHLNTATSMTLTLAPGDVLYLPRGYLYRTEVGTAAATMVHCSVQVWNAGTIADLVVQHVKAKIADTPALRCSMPVAPDLADPITLGAFVSGVQHALQEVLDDIDPADIAAEFLTNQRRTTKPESVSAVHTAESFSTLAPHSELVLRGGINASWERPGLLTGQPGVFIVDDDDEAHVNLLLRDGRVQAGDLSADARRAMEMARRLIRGGWVRVT